MIEIRPDRPLTAIVKAVGNACNLKCRYCFYRSGDQKSRTIMSPAMLQRFFSEYFATFEGRARFIWHGGEPLVAGLEFYRKVIALQQQYRRPAQGVENHIQSNGTLLDSRWAKFFHDSGFKVGLSIDGPRKIHDRFRKTAHGRGSYDGVIRGATELRRVGSKFGVVQVLTNPVPHPGRQLRYFAEKLGVQSWSINPFFASRQDDADEMASSISSEEFTAYVKETIRAWLKRDNAALRIREIDALIAGVLRKRSRACSFNGSCKEYFCVNYNGEVFPCDTCTDDPARKLGDLREQSLFEILSGARRESYLRESRSLPQRCGTCRWQSVCNNGCPLQRDGGIRGQYHFCEARQELFTFVEDLVSRRNPMTS